MSNKAKVANFIMENPDLSNDEIAATLKINEGSVRSYISQLKTEGFIKISNDGGNRTIQTLAEYVGRNPSTATAEKIELKKDVYTKLLNRYLEDFDLTDDVNQHLKLGNSILRILENI